jgi:hypothetical protein
VTTFPRTSFTSASKVLKPFFSLAVVRAAITHMGAGVCRIISGAMRLLVVVFVLVFDFYFDFDFDFDSTFGSGIGGVRKIRVTWTALLTTMDSVVLPAPPANQ